MTAPRPIELGRAVTHGERLPLGLGDPVVAARAVRRALAAAGRRAIDVEAMVVASPAGVSGDVLRTFARRALGPHGQRVSVAGWVCKEDDPAVMAESAATELLGMVPGEKGLGIAVGLGSDGTAIALCVLLRAPEPASASAPGTGPQTCPGRR